jgi:hypothetical protein
MTCLRALRVSLRVLAVIAVVGWRLSASLGPAFAQEAAAPTAADAAKAASEEVYLDEPTPAPEPTVAQ